MYDVEQAYMIEKSAAATIDLGDIIYKGIDIYDNGIFQLAHSGIKGAIDHITVLTGVLGQLADFSDNKFIHKFGYKRSSAYFPTFDVSSESKGLVLNNYFSGLTISQFLFAATKARVNLCSKAIETAKYGEAG